MGGRKKGTRRKSMELKIMRGKYRGRGVDGRLGNRDEEKSEKRQSEIRK